MNNPNPEKVSRRFISLRVKLLFVFSMLFIMLFAGAFYWFYTFSTEKALASIQDDAKNTLFAAVKRIEGDEFAAIYTDNPQPNADGYTDNPLYWKHVEWLLTVHNIEPRAYVYTYIERDGEIVFIGSHGAAMEPKEGAPYLWAWSDIDPKVKQGMLDGLKDTTYANDFQPYKDEFGEWVSSVTPIKNSAGKIVGALGVDFKADYVREIQQGVEAGLAVAFVIIILLTILLVILISNGLTRSIIILGGMAERVGHGEYEQDFSGFTKSALPDEINRLAANFAEMVDKVYQREQTLRARVQQLEIMIDQSKLEQQVSEIVGSDFFVDLKAKVQDMRSRFKKEN